jgi:hypothetical protein
LRASSALAEPPFPGSIFEQLARAPFVTKQEADAKILEQTASITQAAAGQAEVMRMPLGTVLRGTPRGHLISALRLANETLHLTRQCNGRNM